MLPGLYWLASRDTMYKAPVGEGEETAGAGLFPYP